jgi:hypothetical protein
MAKKPKIVAEKVTWLIRAKHNRIHKDVGRSLGLNEMAYEDQLREEMKTSDGVWNLWDCGERNAAAAKALVIDFLQEGKEVFLYRRVGQGIPLRFENEEIVAARQQMVVPETRSASVKSDAMKNAEIRLAELKKRRLKRLTTATS